MNSKKGKTREIDDFIDEADAVCATEMTGLIPSLPADNAEQGSYSQVMKYKPSGKKRKK